MKHRPVAVIAAVAALGLGLTACTSSSGGTAGNIQLVTAGTLTVCTNPPWPPMEYTDDSGNIVGFDIDLMQLVADKLGVKLAMVSSDFAQITSGAQMAAKKCDIGASSITITDDRKQAVNFSLPYFNANQALAVKADSGITGLADLKGKVLAVQDATTGATYANDHAQQYGYTVKTFEDGGVALNAILAGTAAGALIDNAIAYDFAHHNPTTTVAAEFQTGEMYGIIAAKDANGLALLDVVNQVLTTANSDGTYLKLYQKWVDPQATSASMPTAS